MMNDKDWLRLGILSELVSQAPNRLGRTAVMKLAYLLQTVQGVPLGYDFSLYIHGPFQSDVLNDLSMAESLGAVQSQLKTFASGYGYEFTPGPSREMIAANAREQLAAYRDTLRWVLDEFGNKSAADLELLTTIIYADREVAQQHQQISPEELRRRVRAIKPHFSEEDIKLSIENLVAKGLLKALEESV